MLQKEGRLYRFIANLGCGQEAGKKDTSTFETSNVSEGGVGENISSPEGVWSKPVDLSLGKAGDVGDTVEKEKNSPPAAPGASAAFDSPQPTTFDCTGKEEVKERFNSETVSEKVTEVTEATMQAEQEVELSPSNPVSPVTDGNGQDILIEDFWHSGEEIENAKEEVKLNSPSHPPLSELKALLMASNSLAQLKALKKQHGERIKDAYGSLNPQQQLHIDGLEATAVPYKVYKYTGSLIEANGQSLEPGMLVYLDPKVKNQNSTIVPVWLMRGLELGWRQAVSVSKDCLRLIEKAITDDGFRTGLT